jgi:hypothetical protein
MGKFASEHLVSNLTSRSTELYLRHPVLDPNTSQCFDSVPTPEVALVTKTRLP